VGGAERVFELNRNFRNEGVDATRNPEFSMLEAYAAYWDYDAMQVLTQEMIQRVSRTVFGCTTVVRDGTTYDLDGTWRAITVNAAISAALGEEVTADTSVQELRKHCDRAAIPYAPGWGSGQLILETWARRFYRPGSRKLRRAQRRDLKWHGRANRARRWLGDTVAGRPHLSRAVLKTDPKSTSARPEA
jgi:lysyl-tRNA synthetase class II